MMHAFYGNYKETSLKNRWKINKSLFHRFVIEWNFYNKMLLMPQKLNFENDNLTDQFKPTDYIKWLSIFDKFDHIYITGNFSK